MIAATPRKTIALATRMASKNVQLTDERSSSAIDKNIRHGKEKLATKVLRPLVSDCGKIPRRPATYLQQ